MHSSLFSLLLIYKGPLSKPVFLLSIFLFSSDILVSICNLYTHTYTNKSIYAHIHIYVCICIYTRCIYAYIHKILYIYTYKYIHTHRHTFYIVFLLKLFSGSLPSKGKYPNSWAGTGPWPSPLCISFCHSTPFLSYTSALPHHLKPPYSGFLFNSFHS